MRRIYQPEVSAVIHMLWPMRHGTKPDRYISLQMGMSSSCRDRRFQVAICRRTQEQPESKFSGLASSV